MVPAVVARALARGPRPRRATRRSEPTRWGEGDRRVPLSLVSDEADSGWLGRLKPYSGKPTVRSFREPAGNRAGGRTEAPSTERDGQPSERHLHHGACGLHDIAVGHGCVAAGQLAVPGRKNKGMDSGARLSGDQSTSGKLCTSPQDPTTCVMTAASIQF